MFVKACFCLSFVSVYIVFLDLRYICWVFLARCLPYMSLVHVAVVLIYIGSGHELFLLLSTEAKDRKYFKIVLIGVRSLHLLLCLSLSSIATEVMLQGFSVNHAQKALFVVKRKFLPRLSTKTSAQGFLNSSLND